LKRALRHRQPDNALNLSDADYAGIVAEKQILRVDPVEIFDGSGRPDSSGKSIDAIRIERVLILNFPTETRTDCAGIVPKNAAVLHDSGPLGGMLNDVLAPLSEYTLEVRRDGQRRLRGSETAQGVCLMLEPRSGVSRMETCPGVCRLNSSKLIAGCFSRIFRR
jgi:hypothetical protein